MVVKHDQIKQLNKVLDQQQQLQLGSLSKVKKLETKLDEKSAKTNKKWLQFWNKKTHKLTNYISMGIALKDDIILFIRY